jgi:hypothetical protein
MCVCVYIYTYIIEGGVRKNAEALKKKNTSCPDECLHVADILVVHAYTATMYTATMCSVGDILVGHAYTATMCLTTVPRQTYTRSSMSYTSRVACVCV